MKYFITDITEIKENSNIEINLDDNKIYHLIPLVYDKYVKDICGLDDYLDHYNDNQYNWSNDEINVLNMIKKLMYQSVTYEVILNSTFNLTNKGLNQRTGDNGKEVDYQMYGAVRSNIKSNIDMYRSMIHGEMKINDLCKCKKPESNKIFFV